MKKTKEVPEIKEEHIIRRWDLKLRSIRFQNLQSEPTTVFFHFSIGCSRIEVTRVSEAGKKEKKFEGQDGITYKSELLKEVESGEVREVKRNYETEYWATYEMIESLYFEIDVWEYSRWRLNKFLGKLKVPLAEICNGALNRCDYVKVPGGFRKNVCRIWYTLYLQEIWDFKITFSEWRAENIVNSKMEPMNSRLKLSLQTLGLSTPVIKSEIKEKDSTPFWENFNDKKIYFRGTLDDLEDLNLTVELRKWAKINFLNPHVSSRLISLRGVSLSGYIKTSLKFNSRVTNIMGEDQPTKTLGDEQNIKLAIDEKLKSKKYVGLENEVAEVEFNEKEVHNLEEGDANDALLNKSDIDDEAASDGSENEQQEKKGEENDGFMKELRAENTSRVEGRVNLNRLPKYRQKGELIRFKKNQIYLCLLVNRVENVLAPDDRGIIDSFVTLDWGGNIKRTQTYEDSNNPDFNEEIIFKIPLKSQKKKVEKLREELKIRSEINLSLWIDGGDRSNENLGYVRFHLSELASAPKEEKSYQEYYTLRQMIKMVRVATVNRKFSSSLVDMPNTQISFQVWFFPDIPDEINLREFNQENLDRYPRNIQNEMNVNNVQDLEDNKYFKEWEDTIKHNFIREPLEKTVNSLFFKYIYVKDQYGRLHFASKFVDKYLIDDVLPSLTSEGEKGENAENQLNTSDSIFKKDPRKLHPADTRTKTFAEIAHFISTIPYADDRVSNDVWLSPNFVLMLRKGSIHDHSLLMGSLFMGAKAEDEEDLVRLSNKKKQEKLLFNRQANEEKEPEIQDRVFICIGTLSRTRDFYSWIMTINRNFDTVTFWDPCAKKKYELKGRITESEKLKEFLCRKPVKPDQKQQDEKFIPSFLQNILKGKKPKPNEEKPESSNQEEEGVHEEPSLRKKNKLISVKDDTAEIFEDKFFGLDEIDPYFRRDIKKSEHEAKPEPSSKSQKKKKADDDDERKKHTEGSSDKSKFISNYKKEQEDKIKKDKNILKLVPVNVFRYKDPNNPEKEEVAPTVHLPYASIEDDKTNRQLLKYARLLENVETGRIRESVKEQEAWIAEMKKLMPLKYKMKMISMSFNFIQPERIRSLLIKHAASVYMKEAKIVYLGVATKIFPYPNKFNNIRVLIAAYFKEEANKESDDEEECFSEEEPIQGLNEDSERKDLIGKEIFVSEGEELFEGQKTIFSRKKNNRDFEGIKENTLEDVIEENDR